MREQYFVGLDLGQKQDYTAIAVVERGEEVLEPDPVSWERLVKKRQSLRHLERVSLGTPYPDVVRRVGEVLRWEKLAGPRTLVADSTGVGAPVMDLLRAAELGCELVAVTITGGDQARKAEGTWRVPKRDLVLGLQVAMETQGLQIAAGMREAETFVKELTEMRVKVSTGGQEGYAAWREGAHDDLVLAVALACWRARWREVGHQGRPLGVE